MAKGDIRIGVCVEAGESGPGFDVTSYYHPECFKFPRKLGKISASKFVQDLLEDKSDDQSILPDQQDDLIEKLEAAQVAKKKKATKEDGGDETIMDRIKKAATQEDQEGEPAKKKAKTEADASFDQMVNLYKDYKSLKADSLKDFLRYVQYNMFYQTI